MEQEDDVSHATKYAMFSEKTSETIIVKPGMGPSLILSKIHSYKDYITVLIDWVIVSDPVFLLSHVLNIPS